MGAAIHKNGGILERTMGDTIMALFKDNAENAVRAAIAMHKALEHLNSRQPDDGGFEIGIGIHFGEVKMGAFHVQDRLDLALIGDSLNVASRLEGLTHRFGTTLMLSESAFNHLQDKKAFSIRQVALVKIKGYDDGVNVYEVFDVDTPELQAIKTETREWLEKGIDLFQAGKVNDARKIFEKCLEKSAEDSLVKFYLDMCNSKDN